MIFVLVVDQWNEPGIAPAPQSVYAHNSTVSLIGTARQPSIFSELAHEFGHVATGDVGSLAGSGTPAVVGTPASSEVYDAFFKPARGLTEVDA